MGEPLELHTDKGANFESKLIKELCEVYSIEKSRTTPYHPQADGMIERFNRTLLDAIRAHGEKLTDWDTVGIQMAVAYNATVHASTGLTPNRLMFGKELFSATSKIVENPEDNRATVTDYVCKLKKDLMTAYDAVRKTAKKAAINQKRYYDRKSRLFTYQLGQPVWFIRTEIDKRGSKKLKMKYEGPYFIFKILSIVTFKIIKTKESQGTYSTSRLDSTYEGQRFLQNS